MAPRKRRAFKKDNRLEVKKLQKRKEQVKIAMRRQRQNDINTECSQISSDSSHVLAIPPTHHQSDQEISEEPGPSGVFSHTENESPARCLDTDDEDLVTVSIPTKRSSKFYFKSINSSSSKENPNEEIKKKQLIDQMFNEASNFTKTSSFNIFDSSDEDIF